MGGVPRSSCLIGLAGAVLFLTAPAQAQHQYSAEDGSPSLLVLGFVHADFASVNLDEAHREGSKHGVDRNAEEDGFREARLALHLSASLAPSWSFFAEAEFSVFDDDTRDTIERAFLKYDYSDAMAVAAGRFHTPLGWWNTRYHHGRWLQTTVDRPLLWEFGSTFQPAHFQGIQLMGSRAAFSGYDWEYTLGVGAGRAESVFSPLYDVPIDGDTSWFGNLGLSPDRRSGLGGGVSYWFEELEVPGTSGVDETIVAAYLGTSGEQPEFLAEYVRVEHELGAMGGDISHDAWYLQLGYRLDALQGKFKPYARVEDLELDGRDPIYAGLEEGSRRGLLGVRWDFSPRGALKIELRRDEPEVSESFNVLQTQIAFYF